MLMGAGVTPLHTLGQAYLDENVPPKSSPIYMGIFHLFTFFGPGLGYILGGIALGKYVDFAGVSCTCL